MIIDGTHSILGRVATVAAKKALEGEKVIIINCEHIVISGTKESVMAKFKQQDDRGHPFHGPFMQKMPDRFMRRTIRGMLPYKEGRGSKAYDRVMCYLGTPENIKETPVKIENASVKHLKSKDMVTLKELAAMYGRKI